MLNGQFHKQIGNLDLGVSLTVGNNELLVILGASGCGKSTLLNCIAGFINQDKGFLELDKCVYDDTDKGIHIPIYDRQIAYIQQGNTLFPHLSVKENILYSVPKKKWATVNQEYKELLALLNIEELEHRKPNRLSGGEQQRVAIGRALMMSPKLILWDEPFSALDHLIREDLRQLVLSLKEGLNIPMVFVTHDLEEAFQLANRLAIMAEGKILQIGDRDSVFNSPVNELAGRILGVTNSLSAIYIKEESKKHIKRGNLVTFKCDDIELEGVDVDSRLTEVPKGATVQIGIRPEQILYVREDDKSEMPHSTDVEGNTFNATVLSIVKHLENYRLKILIEGLRTPMMMDIPRGVIQRYDIYEGCHIRVLLKYKRILIMNVVDDSNGEPLKQYQSSKSQNDRNQYKDKIDKAYSRYIKMDYTQNTCPVIGISGVSNSGKTTVMTDIISRLSRKNYRIGTVKHDGHGFDMDHEGKDTYRHRIAGAKGVAIASRNQYCVIKQTPNKEISIDSMIKQYSDMDLILVEGYKFSSIPKFEVIRKANSSEGVCREETLIGRITDVDFSDKQVPNFSLTGIDEVVNVIEKILKESPHER